MEKITTRDGSDTFLNKEVGESYHSFTGAVDEALRKFCEPTDIQKRAREGNITLLDFCFGLGYNSAMAVAVALKENPDCHITIIALEKDPRIIELIQEVNPEILGYDLFKQITVDNPILKTTNLTLTLKLGDARELIKSVE